MELKSYILSTHRMVKDLKWTRRTKKLAKLIENTEKFLAGK